MRRFEDGSSRRIIEPPSALSVFTISFERRKQDVLSAISVILENRIESFNKIIQYAVVYWSINDGHQPRAVFNPT